MLTNRKELMRIAGGNAEAINSILGPDAPNVEEAPQKGKELSLQPQQQEEEDEADGGSDNTDEVPGEDPQEIEE
ncbi:hypothetical protein M433DRAFT_9111 [Acidomyces richmondensis BFW]|nr:hypothetical protein M433DRAFT_9111 [Acidomyces richmondensis BFW]